MSRSSLSRVALFGALVACGGETASTTDASIDRATPTDARAEVDIGDGACITPGGYAICGDGCPLSPQCGLCDPDGGAFRCFDDAFLKYIGDIQDDCSQCVVGSICLPAGARGNTDFFLDCAPFELGTLLLAHDAGLSAPVLYYDRDYFTGESIPNPQTCPTIPNVQVCGGNCGGCTTGYHCVGPSPRHPVGFCAQGGGLKRCNKGMPCSGGEACFTFTVSPAAQFISDSHGICVPQATCTALAQSLPGGGTCTP